MSDGKKSVRSAPGYILLEVMVSGALAAVVLAGALTYMAQAKSQTIRGAREQSASSLLDQSVERFMVLPFANLDASNFPTTESVAMPSGGTYTRTHALASNPRTVAGTAMTQHDLTVTVSFSIGNGETSTMSSTTSRFQ